MKRLLIGLCALGLWTADSLEAQAAWNNVFQPTLFGCFRRQTTNYYAAPVVAQASPVVVAQAAPACSTCQPQQQCTTNYTQRCYYQPVTTYENRTFYEPVTTMQTSYYYEPVTSYRYSCYYDPCTCSYQQVATPSTSYQLRAQSSPVQSWVQRCAQVPVTTYRQSCYLEPKTTCCQTTVGAMIPVAAQPQTPVVAQAAPLQTAPPPQLQQTTPPPPSFPQAPSGPSFHSETTQNGTAPSGPNIGGGTQNLYGPNQPQSWRPQNGQPQPQPQIRLEAISQAPGAGLVQGQVAGLSGAGSTILFVRGQERQSTGSDANGNFRANLAPGQWYVYVLTSKGAQYHDTINVGTSRPTQLVLFSKN
jgi:hypothetical protein